jgi:hypothetical protein
MHFIEWVPNGSDRLTSISLTLHYMNFAPNSLYQNQYGFVTEQRFVIPEDSCNGIPRSLFPPDRFYDTLGYSPYSINCYELGVFYYPIILNPYQFNSCHYSHPLQLFMFYLGYSFCEPPMYYITVPYIHYCPSSKSEISLFIIYRVPLDPCKPPICAKWSIYRICANVSTSNCNNVIRANCLILKKIAESIYANLNHLSTEKLIPSALLFHFQKNYNYHFGFNYGLNGSLPSNNGGINLKVTSFPIQKEETMKVEDKVIAEEDLEF